jgi:hypothetical protein
MSLATTLGILLEAPSHIRGQALVPVRPAFAYANNNFYRPDPIQRVREDTEQNYISYSVSQRTSSRSGKR